MCIRDRSYKGTIMLLSLTFALLTRKVTLEQFKTNNVVVLVYLLSIISSISVPIYLIIRVTNVSIAVCFVVVTILVAQQCSVHLPLCSVSSTNDSII